MKLAKKITLAVLIGFFSLVVNAELTDEEKLFFEEVMNNYGFNEYLSDSSTLKSKEKLVEVEDKINRLKKITSVYPDEPRIYFAISRLYSIRDEMLHRQLVFKDRMDWFSIPVVQEGLQGVRDNLMQVARLLEEEKGKPMSIKRRMGSVISLRLHERFQRLYMKQNPNGLECDDPENQDCIPIPYNEFALDTLIDIAREYQAYGYFDDADRLLNEIENFSEEGAAKVAELRPIYQKVRETYVRSEEVKDELSIMLDGSDPKPITIRGIDAIEENHKAALEAYHRSKAAEASSSSSSSVQQSSSAASSAPAVPTQKTAEIDREKLLWIGIAVGVALLMLLVLFRLRKS